MKEETKNSVRTREQIEKELAELEIKKNKQANLVAILTSFSHAELEAERWKFKKF